MKSTSGCKEYSNQSVNGTNTSGFNGPPGGNRYINGSFLSTGFFGFWWSSIPVPVSSAAGAWGRSLSYNDGGAGRYDVSKAEGFSVRCLRD